MTVFACGHAGCEYEAAGKPRFVVEVAMRHLEQHTHDAELVALGLKALGHEAAE